MTDNTITIDQKFPITIGTVAIASLVAKPQTFRGYGDLVRTARKSAGDFNGALFREWIIRNVEARDAAGETVPFTVTDLLGWPAPYGSKLQRLQRASDDQPGSIVKDGNGTDAPCVYQLGKPLPGGNNTEITELEFMIKTVGDIEPLMVAEGKFDQATALVEKCATPLGADVTLQRLPAFALDAMSLVDGLTVMETVLPRFFA